MMLSSIGRRTMMRVGAHGANAANRTFLPIFIVHGVSSVYNKSTSLAIISVSSSNRAYAAATKKNLKSKKASATTKKTKKPLKSSRKASKKPRRVAKKPKKSIKKPLRAKPKKATKARKALTEDQKKARKLNDLKLKALKPPKKLPSTARGVYMAEHLTGSSGIDIRKTLSEFSTKWKTINQSQIEDYEKRAQSNKAANQAAYESWLAQFTPDQIRIANNARKMISKSSLTKKKMGAIVDPRLPKRPLTPFICYSLERYGSGEYSGIPVSEAMKKISRDYNALPPAQRKKYEDVSLQSRQKYVKEFKSVYRRDSTSALAPKTN